MKPINLLITDAYGVYIPQTFCENFLLIPGQYGFQQDDKDIQTCLRGPDTDGYWDAWESILNRAEYHDYSGNKFLLHQDGDLWLLCPALMDAEELGNFGFEADIEEAA